MNRRTKQLISACLVPVLILLGLCFNPLFTLVKGQEITLQTIPIDPSDLFRGDYVTLRYQAEKIPKQLLSQEILNQSHGWGRNIVVYVLLEKKNGVHTPVNVTLEKPEKGIYLKGNLEYIDKDQDGNEVASITYSLDKYYVEDNTGTKWEDASTKGEILAKAKVNNGYAILTGIEIAK